VTAEGDDKISSIIGSKEIIKLVQVEAEGDKISSSRGLKELIKLVHGEG
jgi:hypothetical protein